MCYDSAMPLDDADRVLLARIRDADPDAWRDFIVRFEGRLIAFVDKGLGDRAAAEDVVQETFTAFLESLPNYDDARSALDTFLYAIASHKLTDARRRAGSRPAIPLFLPDDEGRERELPGPSRKASSLARGRERQTAEAEIIAGCLQELIAGWKRSGEFERLECAELLFVMGWPNRDVAHRLAISEQAVANHKQFVVKKLVDAAKKARLRDFDPADVGAG